MADALTMSITALLADEDEWRVACSDRLPLTLLIHSLSAKYALINKLIQQHESSLITHNTSLPHPLLSMLPQEIGRKGDDTYLAEPGPGFSSAQPPCRRVGLEVAPWSKTELYQ